MYMCTWCGVKDARPAQRAHTMVLTQPRRACADIFSPNAAAGVITPKVAAALKCRAIVGAANVPFSCEDAQKTTAERGIVFVPEYMCELRLL